MNPRTKQLFMLVATAIVPLGVNQDAWSELISGGGVPSNEPSIQYESWLVRDDGVPGTSVAGLPDINGNGMPEIVITIPGSTHVYIRDGSTDALISDIDFGSDVAFDMAILPDLDGSGDPEIAFLQQQPSGQVRVQARDSVTGAVTGNLWYGQQYDPVCMDVVSDYSGNGLPEIAVLGSEAGTDAVRVQIQDTSTGFLDNVFLGTQSIAKDLVSVADTSGNGVPEMGILGVLKSNDQVRMQMWDADTAAFQSNVWFAKVYQPQSTITMPDINSNGSDEIVAMGVDPVTQNIRVQVRDSATTATLYNIWLGAVNGAVGIALINDINSNGFNDLAVLLRTPGGTGRVRVQDGGNGTFIRNLFFSVVENPVGLAVMPDYSSNGFDELAVLGENAGVRHVQILDTSTGTQVNRIDFPSAPVDPGSVPHPPSALAVGSATSSSLTLNWTDNSDNETGFRIYRSNSQFGTYSQIATTSATSYTNTGLSASTTYWYKVSAFNSTGDSAQTAPVSGTTESPPIVKPSAPINPAISNITPSSATLSWTDTSNDESGFQIGYCTGLISEGSNGVMSCLPGFVPGTGFIQIAQVGANVTSYTITGLNADTQYSRFVRAYNSAGSSANTGVRFTTAIGQQTVTLQAIASNIVQSNSLDSSWANTAYPNYYPTVGIQWAWSLSGYPGSLAFAGLVKFDISTLQGKTIDSATLNLEANSAPVGYLPQDFDIGTVATFWNPSTVTWNTMANFLYYNAGWLRNFDYPVYAGQTYSIGLTAIVQNWANGTFSNNGLAFLSSNYGVFPGNMTSLDAYDFYVPTLTVTYH